MALAIAMVWDAVSDPLVGSWSDRTVSALGRRRLWLLASCVPLGAFNVMRHHDLGARAERLHHQHALGVEVTRSLDALELGRLETAFLVQLLR